MRIKEEDFKQQQAAENIGYAQTVSYNQVEDLQRTISCLRDTIRQQEIELLNLYRRVAG